MKHIVLAIVLCLLASGAALDAQRALFAEPWPTASPLKVRMAVHTGEARLRDDRNYAGQAVIRTVWIVNVGEDRPRFMTAFPD